MTSLHTPSFRAATGLLALALASPSCSLFDTRSQPRILPAGPLLAGASLTMTVEGPSGAEAQLYVDGKVLGDPVRVGLPATVDMSGVPEGTHALVARLTGAADPRASAPSTLVVDHTPPAVVTSPPEIVADSSMPLLVELRFSEAIDPATLALDLKSEFGPPVPAVQAISGDHRVVTLLVTPPLDPFGTMWLWGAAADPAGNAMRFSRLWHLPDVDVSFSRPSPGARVGGTVQVQAASSESVAQGILYANGVEVGALGPSPWISSWDTTTLPDGSASLRILVPGRRVRTYGLSVLVDNTPPSLLGCAPSRGVDPTIRDCVTMSFSEPVSAPPVTVTIGSASTVVYATYGSAPNTLSVCPQYITATPPAVEVLSFTDVRDYAGNPVAGSCSIPLRAWRRPFGDGPLASAGVPILGTSLAIHTDSMADSVSLFAVAPPDPDGGERLLRFAGTAPGPLASLGALNYVTPSVAAQVRAFSSLVTWTERPVAGPGQVRVRDVAPPSGQTGVYPPLNAGTGSDADHPDVGGESIVAWSEEAATGGRVIRVRRLAGEELGTGVPSSPSALAESPRLGAPVGIPGIVFLEAAPGGAAQVKVAAWSPDTLTWQPVGTAVNLDARVPASDAMFVADGTNPPYPAFIVWVEGGRILARPWDRAALDWGAAEVLNVDPTRPARMLRRLPGATIAFVEATPAGDEVWVRRWEGTSWQLLPGPASEGYSGTISELGASDARAFVAWTDPGGHVYLRAFNE